LDSRYIRYIMLVKHVLKKSIWYEVWLQTNANP
jgi:hypothetical protein